MPPRRVLAPLAIAAPCDGRSAAARSRSSTGRPPTTGRRPSSTAPPATGSRCSTTVAAAIALLDAVGVATRLGRAIRAPATGSRKGDAIAFGAGAALLAASAAYGFKKTSECREAEADLVRRDARVHGRAWRRSRLELPRFPMIRGSRILAAVAPSVSPGRAPGPGGAGDRPRPGSSPWDGANARKMTGEHAIDAPRHQDADIYVRNSVRSPSLDRRARPCLNRSTMVPRLHIAPQRSAP